MNPYSQFICDGLGSPYEVAAPASLSNGSDFWYEPFGAGRNDAGVRVDGYTALGNCHVWKALNVLAGDVGQLPVKMYRKVGGKSKEVENIAEIDCLRVEPNPWMLPSVYKETSMWVAALWGNSVTWVFRPTGSTIRLVPLRPDRVKIVIGDELTGDYFYRYTTAAGANIDLDREEVIHIQGLSCNGIWGYSLLDVAKNVLGGTLALDKYVNKKFANGAMPGGVVKHPGKPTPEARANFRREWNEIHQGVDNASKIALLAEGMDFMPLFMSMVDAQAAELRTLDREFIAELFNLPLFKLNSLEHSSTRSNLEQQNQDYLQGSLMRWLNRFLEEWQRKILSPEMRKDGYYYRWVTEALLRGDTTSRFTAYGIAITNRIMNPNEAREREDMEPYEGGDEFGNPNIDPKADAKAANDLSNAGGRPPGSESADRLIQGKVKQLIKTECNDVERGAMCSNFVEWLEGYYSPGGGFNQLVNKSLLPFVDEVKLILDGYSFHVLPWAANHATESKRLLLKLADQSTADRLTENVKAECETWNARADQ